jgi:hypothetical protein
LLLGGRSYCFLAAWPGRGRLTAAQRDWLEALAVGMVVPAWAGAPSELRAEIFGAGQRGVEHVVQDVADAPP